MNKNSQWTENNLCNITVYSILERADGYESNFYKMYRIRDKCHLRRKKWSISNSKWQYLTYYIFYIPNKNVHILISQPCLLIVYTFIVQSYIGENTFFNEYI